MKKLTTAICLVLLLSLCLTPLCFAAGENFDTLADWDIKIQVPEGKTAALKGSTYYIYAQKDGYIPYVMLNSYRYDSEEGFLADFTAYMQKQYADLTVTKEAAPATIGGRRCTEIDYGYTVSGYEVRDRRVVFWLGGRIYLFGSKEIEARGETVGTLLEDVIANCVFLTADQPAQGTAEDAALADAYVYCLESGLPKYWLDLSYTMAANPVLHCAFRSGDPSFYESCFILDLDSADVTADAIEFHTVTDMRGFDHSDRFFRLALRAEGEALVMEVERDVSKLAGGDEDNLLSGSYRMEPAGFGVSYEYYDYGTRRYWLDLNGEDIRLHARFSSRDRGDYEEVFTLDSRTAVAENEYVLTIRKVYNSAGEDVSNCFKSLTLSEVQGAILLNVNRDETTLAGGPYENIISGVYLFEPHSYLLPADKGPYSPAELARWAQNYYFRETGFFPPEADAEKNADGTYTVHLYEIVTQDGLSHTATSAWYTVDAYGSGVNTITEEPIELCR